MNPGNASPNNPQQSGARSLRLISTSEEPDVSSASGSQISPSPSPALRHLQRELAAALAEARSLRELLEELPAILERKFQQRLQALLGEQRQLERENALLQQHLLALISGGEPVLAQPTLPAAPAEGCSMPFQQIREPAMGDDSPITHGLGLRRALRRLHR